MPVIKVIRKVFGAPTYDISHTVSGTLTFNDRTTVYITSPAWQGDGIYKLYNYTTLATGSDYTIRSILDVQVPSGFSAYSYASSGSVYVATTKIDTLNFDHVQTIDNGVLTFDGPTDIELDASIFTTAGSYALFDCRLAKSFAPDLTNVNVVMSGSTSLTPSAPSIYGPYVITTLS